MWYSSTSIPGWVAQHWESQPGSSLTPGAAISLPWLRCLNHGVQARGPFTLDVHETAFANRAKSQVELCASL